MCILCFMVNRFSLLSKYIKRNTKFNKHVLVKLFIEPKTALENPGCIFGIYTKQGIQGSNSAKTFSKVQTSFCPAPPPYPAPTD